MSDRVLIALPSGQWLALTPDAFREAITEGATFAAPSAPSVAITHEPLVDSEALSAALGIPVSWIEQAARERRIPSLEFGRWRRFRRSDVEAAAATPAVEGMTHENY